MVGLRQEPRAPWLTGDVARWPPLSPTAPPKPGAFHVVGLGTGIGAAPVRSRSRERRWWDLLQLQRRRGKVPPRTEERGREVEAGF